MRSWNLIVPIIIGYLHLPALLHAYELLEDFSGTTFFDKWDFYGHWDNLTLGDVWWLNRTQAFDQRLVYTNEAGNAIIKVDNSSDVPWNEKRNTIRLTSQRTYEIGTIWIADIVHLPFGCSVWPALWTMGTDWPHDGEIDIWYWPRGMIPPSVFNANSTSSMPYIGDWGNPSASFLSTESCNVTEYFGPQKLVLDITLCGTWYVLPWLPASLPELYLPQCASSGPAGVCYLDNVVGPGARYDDAYFEIPYIRTYTTQAGVVPAAAATAAAQIPLDRVAVAQVWGWGIVAGVSCK
ncbi:hypothetical protein MD484_g2527, partial [Candolleomyces efflorescens]